MPCSTNMVSAYIIFGVFLVKQSFHLHLLDMTEMIIANSMQCVSLSIDHLISNVLVELL